MDIPKFSDLVEQKALDGDKVRVDEILNKPIVIVGFQITTSKYKDKGCGYCTKVQFYFSNDTEKKHKVFFSGSGVIKDNIESVKKALDEKKLPFCFTTMVKKVGKYYSLD